MKTSSVFVAALSVLFGVLAQAQTYHTDGGLIITEDSLLTPSHKQLVFVVAQEISGPATLDLLMYTSGGIENHFTPMVFPGGLHRGQIIPIWNGELNSFNSTPWLGFWVTITATTETYYCHTILPVGYWEQYKEPMITSISETGGYNYPYRVTVKGIFDTTIPSLILLNTDVFIPGRTITQTRPGMIQFNMDSNINLQLPPGKYLMTICQAGHCDTLEGRHR